jgi:hypothetical protein
MNFGWNGLCWVSTRLYEAAKLASAGAVQETAALRIADRLSAGR